MTSPLAGTVLDRCDLRARVQQGLDDFLRERGPRLLDMGHELAPLLAALDELLSGGKRLRAGFCFWGHLGAGGTDTPALVRAAAGLEMFQAAAIIHDDLMDGSDTRRGNPAVHRRFALLHEASGWSGSAEAFGAGAAVLLGDLCLVWSDELLGAVAAGARRVFDDMRAELMGGQYLDLLEQVRADGSVESALRVARFKSAKYTIEQPLHLGAALANAPAEVFACYSSYGLPLGEAFQLRDDLLGVFGDPEVTGKPAGDDLREGKRTVLVAMALASASPAQADLVRRKLGDPQLDASGVEDLRAVLHETGAVQRVEVLIAQRTEQALAALDGSPVAAPAVDVLRELALQATRRTA